MSIGLISTEERRKALLLEACSNCRSDVDSGTPWPEVLAGHDNCHGWYHCDEDCCGACETCCVDLEIEDALESWASTLRGLPRYSLRIPSWVQFPTERTGVDGE